MTGSENCTVISTVDASPYVPSAVVAETLDTVGAVLSITIALFAPSELAAPGVARVRVAGLLGDAVWDIVPPFSASEDVPT